jgi:TonB family protein
MRSIPYQEDCMGPNNFVARARGQRAISVFILRFALLAGLAAMALPALAAGGREIRARVMPVYPEIAKRMHISGLVKIEATVDAEGKVTATKALDGNRLLSVSAEEAVKKFRFVESAGVTVEVVDMDFPRVN